MATQFASESDRPSSGEFFNTPEYSTPSDRPRLGEIFNLRKQDTPQQGDKIVNSDIIERFMRSMGSRRGKDKDIPEAFERIGGPLVGTALQSLLLGSIGYGAGRLGSPMYSLDANPHESGKRVALLGALLGAVPNAAGLMHNAGQMLSHPSQAMELGLLSTLNLDVKNRDYLRRMAKRGDYYDPYTHDSVPVGQMMGLVGRSGAPRPVINAVNQSLLEANQGNTRGLTSPRGIVNAGIRMGLGYLIGKPAMVLTAKILGAVAGMGRPAQDKLVRYGTMGAMLAGAFLSGRR